MVKALPDPERHAYYAADAAAGRIYDAAIAEAFAHYATTVQGNARAYSASYDAWKRLRTDEAMAAYCSCCAANIAAEREAREALDDVMGPAHRQYAEACSAAMDEIVASRNGQP